MSAPTPVPTIAPIPTSALTDCTTASGTAGDALAGLGATLPAWNQHHQPDPDHSGGYLPVMQDGIDRYLQLRCTASGRIGTYVITYIPGISLAQMHLAVAAELPPDSRVTSDTTIGSAFQCEIVHYASPTLARALAADDSRGEVDAVITLTNSPENVNRVALSIPMAAPPGTPGAPSC